MNDFNDQVIAEFRANEGQVTTGGFGTNLVLLHTVGARSGVERVNPLFAIRSGEDWFIFASKGGAPDNPQWYFNLRKNPDATIETGKELVAVTATELTGAEREDIWTQAVAVSPGFADYQVRAGERIIPVLRLRRRTSG
jgi:deazaflavin-dependent oxidoreductase (nitroreductase family)